MNLICVRAAAMMLVAIGVRAETREFEYLIDAEIDSTGHVVDADMIDDVDSEFEETIVGLVKNWRFRPAKQHGAEVTSETTLTKL